MELELIEPVMPIYITNMELEEMHEQSFEWLNEIDFWKEEISFYYLMFLKRTLKAVPINARTSIEKIESELTNIKGGVLNDLQTAAEEQEMLLKHLIESNNEEEETYLEKHRLLEYELIKFKRRFKILNRDILALLKQIKNV